MPRFMNYEKTIMFKQSQGNLNYLIVKEQIINICSVLFHLRILTYQVVTGAFQFPKTRNIKLLTQSKRNRATNLKS